MKVTYYGHSCFGVYVAGKHLLFDPFVTGNPLAKSVDIKQIPADYILISHGHDDHLLDAPEIAQYTGATLVANFEVAECLLKNGATKVESMNPGGVLEADFGTVKVVNAIHSSSFTNGDYAGCAAGFVVESAEGSFYYSGDTALTLDMKLISETTQLRFAVLCIGGNFTMGVADAIRAADFVKCDQIMGVHFDTFPQIKIDRDAAQERFKAAGKTLHLLKIGGSHTF
jgi:L-ascorbate metabolism protein UlaG (beta-lactamase superfamily)